MPDEKKNPYTFVESCEGLNELKKQNDLLTARVQLLEKLVARLQTDLQEHIEEQISTSPAAVCAADSPLTIQTKIIIGS
ncbi:MAG TPA: hypothetical protein O0X39_04165 [Methanocorpusculum sp.]|nr:hypothetical protein [Methanocorpusculum sp.]